MIQWLLCMAFFAEVSLAQFDVEASIDSTCATYDGSVKCWGGNSHGSLGTGNTDTQLTPPSSPVDLGAGFVARNGLTHCCAVSTNEQLKCWGQWEGTGYDIDDDIDSSSEFGDNLPELDGPWSGVRDVYVMYKKTCVLDDNGDLYCFGDSFYSQYLFQGWSGYKTASEAVKQFADFTVARVGGDSSWNLCVVSAANEHLVTCSGYIANSPEPVTDRDVGGVVESVGCGIGHCCALTTDKTLDCWGHDQYGAIPDLASDFNIQAVGVGYLSTCVVSTIGAVTCFGETWYNQLGGEDDGVSPYTFQLSPEFTISNIGITSGGKSAHHCVFDKSSPRMQCWGNNYYGQLGYGHTMNLPYSSVPGMVDLGFPTLAPTAAPLTVLMDFGFDPDLEDGLLTECEGDCDVDEDCEGDLKCFKNGPGETNVPTGCSGIAREDMDYCYGHSEPDLEFVGEHPTGLGECEGDCESDADCQGDLKCFHNADGSDNVPEGCEGVAMNSMDYCYSTPPSGPAGPSPIGGDGQYSSNLVDLGWDPDLESGLLSECEGDCDVDEDCEGNLKCFKNGPGESNVPTGCSGIAREEMDYCHNHPEPELEFIVDLDGPLGLCQGDCDSNADCEDGLSCFMNEDGSDNVPEGCEGAAVHGVDYCYLSPNALEWLGYTPATSGSLGMCQGDCDRDSDCQSGLVCVHNALPNGCGGEMYSSFADYCGDSTTNAAANGVADHDPEDMTGSDEVAASFNDFIPTILGAAAGAMAIAAVVAVVVMMRKRKTAVNEMGIEMKAVHVPDHSVATKRNTEMEEEKETEAEMEVVTGPEPDVGAVVVE